MATFEKSTEVAFCVLSTRVTIVAVTGSSRFAKAVLVYRLQIGVQTNSTYPVQRTNDCRPLRALQTGLFYL